MLYYYIPNPGGRYAGICAHMIIPLNMGMSMTGLQQSLNKGLSGIPFGIRGSDFRMKASCCIQRCNVVLPRSMEFREQAHVHQHTSSRLELGMEDMLRFHDTYGLQDVHMVEQSSSYADMEEVRHHKSVAVLISSFRNGM